MTRATLLVTVVAVGCSVGCAARQAAEPAALPPAAAVPAAGAQTLPAAVQPPAWAAADSESDGWYLASASADGPEATSGQAEVHARAELGRIRSVQVRSLVESATVELQRGGGTGHASRFNDASRAYSDTVLAASEVVRREAQALPDGRTRWWAQVRIRTDDLLPERKLAAILARPPGGDRRQALTEEARRALGGDRYRRQMAVLAARLAVSDGGGAGELILLAECLHNDGQGEEAWNLLTGMDTVMEGQPQAVFDRYEALFVQMAASANSAQQLGRHLGALGTAIAKATRIRPSVRRIDGGYEAGFTVPGGPLQLVGLWCDDEDLAPIALPGAERPLSGVYSARFRWPDRAEPPPGRILVLALPPGHPAVPLAAKLAGLDLRRPNRPDAVAGWKAFFAALSLQPYEQGFLLELDPRTP